MSIAVIWSSPNMDGLTAHCKNTVMEAITAAGKECFDIQLNRYNLQRCNVCDSGKGICAEGKCQINDDFSKLYGALVDTEAVIWITPVYWHDMAEPMSAFISRIRRSDPLVNHYLQDKKCIIIACAGKTGNGAVRTVFNMEYIMGQLKMVVRERVHVTPFNKAYILDNISAATTALCAEL